MATIVIYDSGVGGLSIFKEVVQKCPKHNYFFISDNKEFPYGTKAEGNLKKRVVLVCEKIDQHCDPDILIVACNTASTIVLPILRSKYEFSIVGVVPAIKPAAQFSNSKVIGLLATPATVERPYTQTLVKDFANDCEVIDIGSSELVEIAEDKLHGRQVDNQKIETILEPMLARKSLDTVVLACTHFPLLNREIESVFNANGMSVTLIDSGSAIATRVESILANDALGDGSNTAPSRIAVMTRPVSENYFNDTIERFGFSVVETLEI